MRNIEHANIVAYRGSYLDGMEVWLALEYCIGSALDVMEAIKTGLSEPQIYLEAILVIHDNWQHLATLLVQPELLYCSL